MNRADYLTQPFEVSIETLALCNARCTFCPYPTLNRKGTEMSDELIKRLLIEMSTFTQPFFFSPFKVNEPLLDHRLLGICREFNALTNIGRLRLFTNGTPLTPQKVLEIALLDRVEHLWISLNSHDSEEYARIMGLSFDLTLRRLNFLHDEMVAGRFSHPVVVSKVADDDVLPNYEFRDFVLTRWPRFQCVIIKRDGWLGYVEPSNPNVPKTACARWYELNVMATGQVALCCMDGTGEFAIGDITQRTLLDVYNQPSWSDHRKRFITRQQFSPCDRCTY